MERVKNDCSVAEEESETLKKNLRFVLVSKFKMKELGREECILHPEFIWIVDCDLFSSGNKNSWLNAWQERYQNTKRS